MAGDPLAAERLIKSYCAAWSEPHAARRLLLLEQVWAADGRYTDPAADVTGIGALSAYIGKTLERYPGARVITTSRVDAHHGALRFTWCMVLADGQRLPDGTDYAELSADGKIRRIAGFFGSL
jgi:hypothetical protein